MSLVGSNVRQAETLGELRHSGIVIQIQHTRGADIEDGVNELVQEWVNKRKGLTVQKVFRVFLFFRMSRTTDSQKRLKGTNPAVEAYSVFASAPPVEPKDSPLAHDLFAFGIKTLFVVGLATDYCVRNCALDAKKAGFDVLVIREAVRAVGGERATKDVCAEWNNAGIEVVSMRDVRVQKHLVT